VNWPAWASRRWKREMRTSARVTETAFPTQSPKEKAKGSALGLEWGKE